MFSAYLKMFCVWSPEAWVAKCPTLQQNKERKKGKGRKKKKKRMNERTKERKKERKRPIAARKKLKYNKNDQKNILATCGTCRRGVRNIGG